MNKDSKPLYVIEIDFHCGGRCYYISHGITTNNPKYAFKRTDIKVLERMAAELKHHNPKIVPYLP